MKTTIFFISAIGLVLLADCQHIKIRWRPAIRNEKALDDCTTPDGKKGDCYNIKQCPELLELLRSSKNNPAAVEFLRRSVCGYDNTDPKVCCPAIQANGPVWGNVNTIVQNETTTESPPPQDETDDFPNILSPPDCGFTDISHTRIVGGAPSELGDNIKSTCSCTTSELSHMCRVFSNGMLFMTGRAWPWIAALGYRSRRASNSKLHWLCGATLVSTKHLITAGHCTKHPSLALSVARLGELDLNDTINDGANPIDVEIQRALTHPSYSASKFQNDIAIVYLKTRVKFTPLIQPVCLPKSFNQRMKSYENTFPYVAGWGSIYYGGPSSSKLQEIQIPVVENELCRKIYAKLGGEITLRQICVGDLEGELDACRVNLLCWIQYAKSEKVYLKLLKVPHAAIAHQ